VPRNATTSDGAALRAWVREHDDELFLSAIAEIEGIMLERRATSSRNAWAISSESALPLR
jgi:hypothetical protein